MQLAIAAVIGLLAGTHCATWGMYKDAPHEGFTVRRYSRSIVVGLLTALGLHLLLRLDLTSAAAMVLFFGLCYVTERGIVEVYKTFIREEDQSKYFIPMQFHVKGKVVQSRSARLLAGFGYVVIVVAALIGIHALQDVELGIPRLVMVLLIGSIGGWISAFGGAWKDAPIEGFEIFKFFRSPLMTMFYAFLFSFLTDSYLMIALTALGYERATIETYKTFFFPNKPRGKFAGKPVHFPEMLSRRHYFVPLYVGIWLVVIAAGVIAFTRPGERVEADGILARAIPRLPAIPATVG
jgi:hypothetical protein